MKIKINGPQKAYAWFHILPLIGFSRIDGKRFFSIGWLCWQVDFLIGIQSSNTHSFFLMWKERSGDSDTPLQRWIGVNEDESDN